MAIVVGIVILIVTASINFSINRSKSIIVSFRHSIFRFANSYSKFSPIAILSYSPTRFYFLSPITNP